jgi:hypothetical protein
MRRTWAERRSSPAPSGVPTDNTAKWISEHRSLSEREARLRDYAARMAGAYPSPATRQLQMRARAELAAYRRRALRPGQLVIIDEASITHQSV